MLITAQHMNKRRIAKALKRLKHLPANKYFFRYAGNKLKHLYLKATGSTRVAYPSTVMLELTNRCNLRCTICPREYEYGKQMDKGDMDIQLAQKIIDELWPYLDSIGLTGMGETFLYDDLEGIVNYIKTKNRGIIISLSTNAVALNFIEKAKRIIGKVDTIQVSIDGVDEVYNSIRRGSSFEYLSHNVRELVDLCKGTQTAVMLNMVVTKENYIHMASLVEFASEIGVRYLDFTLLNLAAVTNIDTSYYQFYKLPDFKTSLNDLEKAIQRYPEVIVTNKNFTTHNSFQKCPFPWTHFYITWDGYLVPCCAKPFPKEMNFGNIREKTVLNALNTNGYRNFRKMWLANTAPNFCHNCHFLNIEPV